MPKKRLKTSKPKTVNGFRFRLLFLSIMLGATGGFSALLVALLIRGYEIRWESLSGGIGGFFGSAIAISQQKNKSKRSGDHDADLDGLPVSPNKPTPFNPPLREAVSYDSEERSYSDTHRYLN